MHRTELETYILENYGAKSDHPWMKYPTYAVFRHEGNQKWFALLMDVPKEKLGLEGTALLDIANFKCDSALIGTLRQKKGFFPAYHMNKDNWITVALDGSVPNDEIEMLVDMSYALTAPMRRKKRK